MMSQFEPEVTEVFRLDKICRLCLVEKSSMLRIFATKNRDNAIPLPIRIMSCASLEVYEGDGLPEKICYKCYHRVNQSYSFREQCDAANRRLLNSLHTMKNSSECMENMEPKGRILHEYISSSAPENEEQSFVGDLPTKVKEEPKPIKMENVDIEDEEDNKPISHLLKEMRHTDKKLNGRQNETDDDDAGDVADCNDDDDNDGEPVASLVVTEMPRSPKNEVGGFSEGDSNVRLPRKKISVRQFLEHEFGEEYNTHRMFMLGLNSDCGKNSTKKRQKSSAIDSNQGDSDPSPSWTNLKLDLPRRKYAPRDKNLISNNSSPIIEQDGTKSKFRACIHCGKVVLGKNMGIHVKIHVGNKSHLCDICGKSFLYKKTLETHKRVHSGERPCICKVCNKTFRSSSRLSDHMSTHTGRKPFICEICAVAFRIKGHLKKHLRVHSGEKPYICHFCEKAFSDAWNMKCHLRIHTGEKPPHACPVCAQCFLRRNKMEEHCKLTHGEEFVLPRKQAVIQRLKNDLVESSDELRAITQQEQEDAMRQATERQLLQLQQQDVIQNHLPSSSAHPGTPTNSANSAAHHHPHHQHQQQQQQQHHHEYLIPTEHLATIAVPMPMSMPIPVPVPVPAFPGNLPAVGMFGLQ